MSKTVPLSPSGHPVTEKQQLSVCDVYSTQLVYCVDQPNRELYSNELVLRERVQTKAITIIPHSVEVTEPQRVVTVQYNALQPVGTTISEALSKLRSSLLYTVVYCVIPHTLIILAYYEVPDVVIVVVHVQHQASGVCVGLPINSCNGI